MSFQDVWQEYNQLRKDTQKAKYRTMSEHAKLLHPLTAYTHMFEPMGELTNFLGSAHAWRAWSMQARNPSIRQYAVMVCDLQIRHIERHMSRWQGQDEVLYDDDQTKSRRILYQGSDRPDYAGLDEI